MTNQRQSDREWHEWLLPWRFRGTGCALLYVRSHARLRMTENHGEANVYCGTGRISPKAR